MGRSKRLTIDLTQQEYRGLASAVDHLEVEDLHTSRGANAGFEKIRAAWDRQAATSTHRNRILGLVWLYQGLSEDERSEFIRLIDHPDEIPPPPTEEDGFDPVEARREVAAAPVVRMTCNGPCCTGTPV